MSDHQSTGSSGSHASYDSIENDNTSITAHDAPLSSPHLLSPRMIQSIFLLLGVGSLLPWNAFVSAKPYFQSRLCNSSRAVVVPNFEMWFGLIWNTSSVLSLGILLLLFSQRKSGDRHSSSTGNSTSSRSSEEDTPMSWAAGDDTLSPDGSSTGSSFWLGMVPLSIYFGVFVLTAAMVLVPTMDPQVFWICSVTTLSICGTCGAIATSGMVSTAGLYETADVGITPFFSGQALGGVAVSLANFVAAIMEDPDAFDCETHRYEFVSAWETETTTRRLYDDDEIYYRDGQEQQQSTSSSCSPYTEYDWAVFFYFVAGCLVLALCLVGYSTIHKQQQHLHQRPTIVTEEEQQEQSAYEDLLHIDQDGLQTNGDLVDNSPRIGLEMKTAASKRKEAEPSSPVQVAVQSYHNQDPLHTVLLPQQETVSLQAGITTREEVPDDEEENVARLLASSQQDESQMAVFYAIKGPVLTVFLTFAVTLCMFPGWVSQLRSVNECHHQHGDRMSNDLYVPFRFVIFNAGDLLGRMLSSHIDIHKRRKSMSTTLVVVALCRLAFVPLFLLCVASTTTNRRYQVENDMYSLFVQLGFAVSNGMLVSCSFMLVPQLVPQTASIQERASGMMTFAINFGLLTGSLLSIPFLQVATTT